MGKPKTIVESLSLNQENSLFKDLLLLFKFRLSFFVVMSSMFAYMIVAPVIALSGLGLLMLGGFLVTASANSINQILEREYDSLMVRTAGRPLAAGRMGVSATLMTAGFMLLFGFFILSAFNPLTGFLGMVAFISYAFIYTPLKRVTPFAVAIGAFPGALPVVIGVTAAVGEINTLAVAFFGIQFLWQFAHFWSIAWLADRDYKNAGFILLPSKSGKKDSSVGLQCFLYSVLLVPFSFLPWVLGYSALITVFLAGVIAVWYCWMAWKFFKQSDDQSARKLMFSSFVYLPMVLMVFLLDTIILGQ